MEVEKIKEEMKESERLVLEAIGKRDEEVKSIGKATEETGRKLDELGEKYLELHKEKKGLEDMVEKLEAKMKTVPISESREYKTHGQIFVESEEFKNSLQMKRTNTGAVDVGSLFRKAISNALVGDAEGRAPVYADRIAEFITGEGHREFTIRDIMNVASTSSNAIDYFKEEEGAGSFKEDRAKSQDGETKAKHQMKMSFEPLQAPVQTIAGWLPVSRQVLADAPQLQSYIDTRLRYKVLKEYEDQILFGSGVSGELLGIHNTAGVQTVGWPTGGDTQLDHIRKAFARVRVEEYFATAIILHPNDWCDIELLKGSDSRYVWTSVPDGGVSRLWRVPVVETTAMEEARFLTGAFGIGAQLFEREGATIRLAEQHSDYFVRNAVAVLGELRAALAVYRPNAFIKGVFSDDVST